MTRKQQKKENKTIENCAGSRLESSVCLEKFSKAVRANTLRETRFFNCFPPVSFMELLLAALLSKYNLTIFCHASV